MSPLAALATRWRIARSSLSCSSERTRPTRARVPMRLAAVAISASRFALALLAPSAIPPTAPGSRPACDWQIRAVLRGADRQREPLRASATHCRQPFAFLAGSSALQSIPSAGSTSSGSAGQRGSSTPSALTGSTTSLRPGSTSLQKNPCSAAFESRVLYLLAVLATRSTSCWPNAFSGAALTARVRPA